MLEELSGVHRELTAHISWDFKNQNDARLPNTQNQQPDEKEGRVVFETTDTT